MRTALVALVVLALCVVGLLVTGLFENTVSEEDVEPYESSMTDSPPAGEPERAAADEAQTDARAASKPARQPLVPRVLPPDAAREDVRDALAAEDTQAVRAAYEQITRMSRKSAGFGASITKLARDESDARVARILVRAVDTPWNDLEPEERNAFTKGDR